MQADLRQRKGIGSDPFDAERVEKFWREVSNVVRHDGRCADVDRQRKEVTVRLVHGHRIDERGRHLDSAPGSARLRYSIRRSIASRLRSGRSARLRPPRRESAPTSAARTTDASPSSQRDL